MPRKRLQTSSDRKPPEVDDLKKINGIGPAVEHRLHRVGIFTFAQLAALSSADVAAPLIDLTGLTAERINKQDWIGQARRLALESTRVEQQGDVELSPDTQPFNSLIAELEEAVEVVSEQQYPAIAETGAGQESARESEVQVSTLPQAVFTIEFTLDQDNSVQHTRIVHIQSGDEDQTDGWQESRMLQFLHRYVSFSVPQAEILANEIAPETASLNGEYVTAMEASTNKEAETQLPVAEVEAATPVNEPGPVPVIAVPPSQVLRLREIEAISARTKSPHCILPYGQPFDVNLTLDVAEKALPEDRPFNFAASIYARRLGNHERHTIGEAHGDKLPSDKITVKVDGSILSYGIYRLEGSVSIKLAADESPTQSDLVATIKGSILQVY